MRLISNFGACIARACSLTAGAILMLAVLTARAQVSTVHAWQGTISIPTYKLGPADPNPSFPLVNSRDVYPYTMLDDLTRDKAAKTYKALYLENQYLRIIILPQLGGHVYSIYDKINHREVLYRDHVIKYGLVGPRGAWISGGMEFSFPYAHTDDSVSPVESSLRHNPDGSATATVGAIDWVSNMYWQIALTLRPNTARLQEDVTLFNATPQKHLYLFWTNTAVKAADDLQYIYPMRETIDDDPFAIVQSWPMWNGIDQSWYKNVPFAMAIFGRAVHRNFFGVYYHSSDYGVVHVADYRQDPGKKIWSWGTARSGRIWDKLLSDDDGPYNEIQSGRFYTQGYREFMEPRRVERWTEYWYPVSGLKDGFLEATSKMAMNVNYSTGTGSEGNITVSLSPAADVTGASLFIKDGQKVLREQRAITLIPLHTTTYTVPVKDMNATKEGLAIDVVSSTGQSILHWSAAEPLDGNPDFVPRAGTQLQSEIPDSPQTPTQALYMRGLLLEKMGEQQSAIKVYDEVLHRDPDYVPALVKEAWIQCDAGDFAEAQRLLSRAETRNEADPAVQYALGVVYRAEGRLSRAEDGFWTTIHYGGPPAPALVELGEIEIHNGRYLEAEKLLKRAVGYNPDDAFALADLSVAQRLAGKVQDAAESSAKALENMPLLPYALAEQLVNGKEPAGWEAMMNSDPENYLAVAAWYHSLGAWRSADTILKGIPQSAISPIVSYYFESDARHEGDPSKAEGYAREAAASTSVAVFPNRVEDYSVLEEALQANPDDAQAKYEMGNFLFAHGRYAKAASLWREAVRAGFNDSVIQRNLGVYDWHVQHDLAQAAKDFLRAIQLSPHEYRLYPDLDEIYEQEGSVSARAELFRSAPADVLSHDTVQARQVVYMMEQKQYSDALAEMKSHSFTPWEGGMAMHNMYVFANMQSGKQELADRQPVQAEEYFRAAMLYPENLGTGEPDKPDTSEQLFWLGNAMEARGKEGDAKAAWQKAVDQGEKHGGSCRIYAALADQKLRRHDVAEDPLQHCIQAAEKPDATATTIYYAGIAEQYSGNDERAHKDFLRVLEIDPLHWRARIELTSSFRFGSHLP